MQTQTWHPANPDGSRDADVNGEISGTQITLKGTASISSTGGETVQAIGLDIKVAVPLIGRKMELIGADHR